VSALEMTERFYEIGSFMGLREIGHYLAAKAGREEVRL
jgi:hypothetical protein